MKVRLGTLRRYILEQAMVPGRWYGGEEPEGEDRERVGDPLGMDETDERMEGDQSGNGHTPDDVNNPEKLASHLRGSEEDTSLGTPGDRQLSMEIRNFFLQEEQGQLADTPDAPEDGPTPEPGAPSKAKGFYSDFDMTRDHTGTDNFPDFWYRSPGREPGSDGDPFRGTDPYAQLGFHPPAAQNDPTTTPPGVSGEEGAAALNAPKDPSLTAGGSTSKALGANANSDKGVIQSAGGTTRKEPTKGSHAGPDTDESEGEGQEQG